MPVNPPLTTIFSLSLGEMSLPTSRWWNPPSAVGLPRVKESAMTSSKHDKALDEGPMTSDLDRNPEIGQSKGAFGLGETPETIEGESTVEGDVENDPAADGSIPEGHLGRTNS